MPADSTRSPRTDYLFARPSFLTGVARVFDLGGTLSQHSYNHVEDGDRADALAIASDWAVVGEDLRFAMADAPRRLLR